MIDIEFTHPTVFLWLYCVFLLVSVSLFNLPGILKRNIYSSYGLGWKIFVSLVILCIITFCLDPDFFTYQNEVHNYRTGEDTHFEPIYGLIISMCLNNYLLFRILIWGGAILITIYTFKLFQVDRYLALYLLFSLYMTSFYYARASVAMAFFYCGLAVFLNSSRHNIIKYANTIILFGLSCSFHLSMLIGIAVVPISLVKLDRIKILLLIVIAIVFAFFAKVYVADLFTLLANSSEDRLEQKLNFYGNLSDDGISLNLFSITYYLRFYLPLFYITKVLFFNIKKQNFPYPKWVKPLYNIVLSFSLISIVLLGLDYGSLVFFNRILYMSMIGICILLSFLFKNKLISREQLLLCILNGIFAQTYRMYLFRAFL